MSAKFRWACAWSLFGIASVVLAAGSIANRIPISLTEVLGFLTGAACVMLVVTENIWNFPIGLANNIFFIVLFWQSRLYGDMGLQVVYIVLGVIGWYQWLRGGERHGRLKIKRIRWGEAAWLLIVTALLTAGFTVYFRSVNDSSPFLDGLTTALSLAAQWLLNGKRIENWFVWITADVLYVYLYAVKGLHLTAILYAGFIGLCVSGLMAWRRSLNDTADRRERKDAPTEAAVP